MKDRPNFLFLMTDQEQAQILEEGHPCKTPHADRLRREGISFSHAFTPMAHCCPARASLMTGMYPSKHGVHNNVQNGPAFSRSLNEGCETFAEKLKAEGYNLSYSGKWHVSATQDPKDFGWEEVEACTLGVYPHQDYEVYLNMPKEDTELRKRGEMYAPGWHRGKFFGPKQETKEDAWDNKINQAGIGKIKEFAQQDNPWCVFISLIGPHAPFVVPEKYATMYDPAEIQLPESYMDEMSNRPRLYQRMQKKNKQFSEDEVREATACYWGYCTMLDEMVGEALDALDATGQADNTVVIHFSDHGDFCGAHGLFAKGIPAFDEAYRVPYIIRWPDGIKNPGRIVDEFITHCDVSPTITELAGAEPTADPSGRSLVSFLKDEKPEDWPDAFYNQCNGVEIYYTQRMVRTKKYKLVYNPVDMDELYDLENDPHEMHNLIDKEELQPVIKELFKKIWLKGKEERDYMSGYHTISHAPYGPAFALGK